MRFLMLVTLFVAVTASFPPVLGGSAAGPDAPDLATECTAEAFLEETECVFLCEIGGTLVVEGTGALRVRAWCWDGGTVECIALPKCRAEGRVSGWGGWGFCDIFSPSKGIPPIGSVTCSGARA